MYVCMLAPCHSFLTDVHVHHPLVFVVGDVRELWPFFGALDVSLLQLHVYHLSDRSVQLTAAASDCTHTCLWVLFRLPTGSELV